jgi:hypothetical protein
MDSHSKSARSSYEFARRTIAKIIKHPSPYLNNKDMTDLGIKCIGLDLETGKPTDGGPVFISPYPLTEIDRILQENKPWREYELEDEKDSMNMCAAMEISALLEHYLVVGADEDADGLINQTKWRMRQ